MSSVSSALRVEEERLPPVVDFKLTHRNHFKFGYNGDWFAERRNAADEWTVAYGRCEREPRDWRHECIDTARVVRENTNLDLWLMYSGGIDSEVALQSFQFAGIPVRAAITCFKNDLNRQDVRYAVKFCETHQIEYRLLSLDIERFVESGEAMEYADRTKCVQPQLLHTMWAMDQIDGYPILGSAECYLVRRPAQDDVDGVITEGEPWDMYEKERVASWYRHLMVRRREGCAGFFQYTPEIMLSFLLDPTIAHLCANKYPEETDTMKFKPNIYRRYFLLEPRKKYHGFENVMHLNDILRPELERRHGDHNAIWKTPYDSLIEGLRP